MSKREKGQFYTTNTEYILGDIEPQFTNATKIIEPFAGQGDLINWIQNKSTLPIVAYDIDPKCDGIERRDTLLSPPKYKNTFIITNPPYLARNKSKDKTLFDKYHTNDLYKCFILSMCEHNNLCTGGVIIIPAGFFFSSRDIDTHVRNEFLTKYKILRVKYFEETVFDDTKTTVVVISFVQSLHPLEEQIVKWTFIPTLMNKSFKMQQSLGWIIGGEIYLLGGKPRFISRHVEGSPLKGGEQQTFMTLNALDSGKATGRISLNYKRGYIYPAKDCSRTYATLRIKGYTLSEEEQINICKIFNERLEDYRKTYFSLFLPQFRESKEYARKRIPFELAYSLVEDIILNQHDV